MKRKLIGLILVLLVVGGASWLWFARASGARAGGFRTTELKRGDLRATITASGTLEPEDIVDVGAQVVGQIIGFGGDLQGHGGVALIDQYGQPKPIDYGSEVEPGMVLARIDDALYKAKVEQS